jgi:hypothetical protein
MIGQTAFRPRLVSRRIGNAGACAGRDRDDPLDAPPARRAATVPPACQSAWFCRPDCLGNLASAAANLHRQAGPRACCPHATRCQVGRQRSLADCRWRVVVGSGCVRHANCTWRRGAISGNCSACSGGLDQELSRGAAERFTVRNRPCSWRPWDLACSWYPACCTPMADWLVGQPWQPLLSPFCCLWSVVRLPNYCRCGCGQDRRGNGMPNSVAPVSLECVRSCIFLIAGVLLALG